MVLIFWTNSSCSLKYRLRSIWASCLYFSRSWLVINYQILPTSFIILSDLTSGIVSTTCFLVSRTKIMYGVNGFFGFTGIYSSSTLPLRVVISLSSLSNLSLSYFAISLYLAFYFLFICLHSCAMIFTTSVTLIPLGWFLHIRSLRSFPNST